MSYNNLDNTGTSSDQTDFSFFTEMRELYLHHNRYTYLPHYYANSNNIYTLADLTELQIIDLSHNSIVNFSTGPIEPPFGIATIVARSWRETPINLNYDEFSQISELYFHHNEFSFLSDYVYQARHLKVADFSHNKITFSEIWPKNTTTKQLSLSGHKTIYLQSNLITKLDLSVLNESVIGQLHDILQNFHFHLNGNPINCNCDSFRTFKYLISSSRTERLNEQLDENHLPDFSFYKNHWKCVYVPT